MGYDLNKVREEFIKVCTLAGVPCNIPISLNGRLTRTLGRVMEHYDSVNDIWYSTEVQFSRQLLETASDASVRDVILHEAAHYIVTYRTGESHGHDNIFKAVCAEIGTSNDGVSTKVERTVAEDSLTKYAVYCDGECGGAFLGGYSRMCNTLKNIKSCNCKRCGSNKLRVVQNW